MNGELQLQISRLLTMLDSLEGIELTEDEKNFIKWLSEWDLYTTMNFTNIIKKSRNQSR